MVREPEAPMARTQNAGATAPHPISIHRCVGPEAAQYMVHGGVTGHGAITFGQSRDDSVVLGEPMVCGNVLGRTGFEVSPQQTELRAVVGGVGYGAAPDKREAFRDECEAIARAFETEGSAAVAARYSIGPARVQFLNKDPRGHAEFAAMLAEHSAEGAAGTMRGFQKERPSLYDLTDRLAAMTVPMLIMVGDEDEGAIEPSIMLKRTITSAGLVFLPKTGHTLNLEEPDMYNRVLAGFLANVAAGSWGTRDPRSLQASTTGMA